MSAIIREPLFEGLFYPDDPEFLKNQIRRGLDQQTPAKNSIPKGLFLPHGAYELCSDHLDAAFGQLIKVPKNHFHRIILIAPALEETTKGIKLSESDYFRSPIGQSPIDTRFSRELNSFSMAINYDETTHLQEYSIEIILPYIHVLFPDIPIVPLLVKSGFQDSHWKHLSTSLKLAHEILGGNSLFLGISNLSIPGTSIETQNTAKTLESLLVQKNFQELVDCNLTTKPFGIPIWLSILNTIPQECEIMKISQGESLPILSSNGLVVQYASFCIH